VETVGGLVSAALFRSASGKLFPGFLEGLGLALSDGRRLRGPFSKVWGGGGLVYQASLLHRASRPFYHAAFGYVRPACLRNTAAARHDQPEGRPVPWCSGCRREPRSMNEPSATPAFYHAKRPGHHRGMRSVTRRPGSGIPRGVGNVHQSPSCAVTGDGRARVHAATSCSDDDPARCPRQPRAAAGPAKFWDPSSLLVAKRVRDLLK